MGFIALPFHSAMWITQGMSENCQLVIGCSTVAAQEKFTERLQLPVIGQGVVRLHHNIEIESLLYGRRLTIKRPTTTTHTQLNDSVDIENQSIQPSAQAHKVRITGYRVQVYAGGNSRDAKRKAYQMESLVRSNFPDQPVYTRFVSPRWICHVGDFHTRAEALHLLSEMRATGKFSEAITVRCKINTYIYDGQ